MAFAEPGCGRGHMKERTEQHQHIGSIHAESGSSITIQQSVSTPAPAAPGPIEDPPLINPIRPWIERLLSGLPLRSADAVQRFLLHYLDTDDAPKSFVGRDATLDRLQRWACGSEGTRYQLLVAPTGRGKSALVCRLIESLANQDGLRIAFLPISIRFNLSLAGEAFTALLGRLAALHGDPAPHNLGPESERVMVSQYLRRPLPNGDRLLVVLDGIDEASDWSIEPGFLPPDLPACTRVLLTMRQTAEADAHGLRLRLGLQKQSANEDELAPLTEPDILAALRAKRLVSEHCDEEAAAARRLFVKSEGDPLTLNLLIDPLDSSTALRDWLAKPDADIPVGLSGVWESMIKTSERGALQHGGDTWRILSVLACALAPVARDDLMELANIPSGEGLDQAMKPVARWILRVPGGYTFCLPKLREFFYEQKLGDKDRRACNRRFVDWGELVLQELRDERRTHEKVPEYLLQCLTEHMRRSNASPLQWSRLLCKEWKHAWEFRPLGQRGLLRDIEHAVAGLTADCARDIRHRRTPTVFPSLLRSLMWRSSILSLTKNLPLNLLAPCVEYGVMTPAEALAHLRIWVANLGRFDHIRQEHTTPALKLLKIIPESLLSEALDIATEWTNHERGTVELLVGLIPRLVPNHLEGTLLAIRLLRSRVSCVEALFAVIQHVPQEWAVRANQLRKEALDRIRAFPRPWPFVFGVSLGLSYFDAQTQLELLDEGLTAARSFPDSASRKHQLVRLLKALPPERAGSVLHEALTAAFSCDSKDYPFHEVLEALPLVDKTAGADVVRRMIQEGQLDSLVQWIHLDTFNRWSMLESLLSTADMNVIAAALLEAATSLWFKDWNITHLIQLARLGRKEQVVAIIRATANEEQRAVGLVRAADLLPPEERVSVLGDALQNALPDDMMGLIEQLCTNLSDEFVPQAVTYILTVPTALARVRGLLYLLPRCTNPLRETVLLTLESSWDQIAGKPDRLGLLADICLANPTESAVQALLQLMSDLATTDETAVDSTMRRLASSLPEPYRLPEPYWTKVWRTRLEMLSKQDSWKQVCELSSILKQSENIPSEAIQRARRMFLALYSNQTDSRTSFHQLTEVVPHLESDEEKICALRDSLRRSQRINDAAVAMVAAAHLEPTPGICRDLLNRATSFSTPQERFLALAALSRTPMSLKDEAITLAVDAAKPVLFHPQIHTQFFVIQHARDEIRRATIEEIYNKLQADLREVSSELESLRAIPVAQGERSRLGHMSSAQQQRIYSIHTAIGIIGRHLTTERAEHILSELPRVWVSDICSLLPALSSERRESIIQELLEESRRMHPVPGSGVTAQLLPHVQEPRRVGIVDELLSIARLYERPGHSSNDNRITALWAVAPFLEERHLSTVVPLLCSMSAELSIRHNGLLQRVPGTLRQVLVSQLHTAAQSLENHSRARLLIELSPYLDGRALREAVESIPHTSYPQGVHSFQDAFGRMDSSLLLDAFRLIHEVTKRSQSGGQDPVLDTLGLCGARLADKDPSQREMLLKHLLGVLRDRGNTRSQLMTSISSMAPLIRALGTAEQMDALAREILDVQEMWP